MSDDKRNDRRYLLRQGNNHAMSSGVPVGKPAETSSEAVSNVLQTVSAMVRLIRWRFMPRQGAFQAVERLISRVFAASIAH